MNSLEHENLAMNASSSRTMEFSSGYYFILWVILVSSLPVNRGYQ
jgi:hypothetical protein